MAKSKPITNDDDDFEYDDDNSNDDFDEIDEVDNTKEPVKEEKPKNSRKLLDDRLERKRLRDELDYLSDIDDELE